MAATGKSAKGAVVYTTRHLFGLAKELGLSGDEARDMAHSMIGKESIKDFTQRDLATVCHELIARKEGLRVRPGRATDRQLYQIKEYEQLLGWAESPLRLQAFTEKYYGVISVMWLTKIQASKLIDSLKKMYERTKKKG